MSLYEFLTTPSLLLLLILSPLSLASVLVGYVAARVRVASETNTPYAWRPLLSGAIVGAIIFASPVILSLFHQMVIFSSGLAEWMFNI